MTTEGQQSFLFAPNGGPITSLYSPRALEPLATRYLQNYPKLYHFTNEEGAEKIIESRSLLARNILDFGGEDPEEYKHGIKLMADFLFHKMMMINELPYRPPNFEYLEKIGLDIKDLFKGVVKLVNEELDRLKNYSAPRVTVYVACLSSNPANIDIANKFGRYRIEFGPLLPVLAYANTVDAHASMLTRVVYSEEEFKFLVMKICTDGAPYITLQRQIGTIPRDERLEFAIETFAIHLMAAAANIKRSVYTNESEWRLKSYFFRDFRWDLENVLHPNRKKIWLPEASEFTEHQPPRLIQRLRIFDKAIINMVKLINDDGSETRPKKFDELRKRFTTGQMNVRAAELTIHAKQLT